ncbi:hypothetical protein QQZ08_009451 [Neonectria magnoliae]|uniref:Uncharacterized protein n=1 Tax=Neonectria magnoliae TaxID=2732573 RepID=A0ABR1HP02_9HYPO
MTAGAIVGGGAAVAEAAAVAAAAEAAAAAVAGASVGMAAAAGAAEAAAAAILSGAASTAALEGAVTASMFAGPIGWAIVGADGYTWDCWKPVVMDDSITASRGITLRDLYKHTNLRRMIIEGDGFVAENVRSEKFRLSPVDVDGTLAFHATSI